MADARGLRPIACLGRKHFEVEPDTRGKARVICRDKRCRHTQGEIVVHTFDLASGEYTTRRFAKWRATAPTQG